MYNRNIMEPVKITEETNEVRTSNMEEEEAAELSANLEDSNSHYEDKLVIKVSTKAKVLPTIPEEETMEDQADINMNRKYEFAGFLEN